MVGKKTMIAVLAGAYIGGILLFTPTVTGQPQLPDKAKDWDYIGHNQCKVCHNSPDFGAQYKKWSEMDHANALEALKSDEAKAIAQERGMEKPPHEAPECLKCHVTGYDAETGKLPSRVKMEDSVGCESCHGPMSAHQKVAQKLKFNPKSIADVKILDTVVEPTEATCRGCHNEESPTWDTEKYTLEDGTTAGFDFEQASEQIRHEIPDEALKEKYGDAYPID